MFGMFRALTQLLQIWWAKDRIRVARSEGKLFRIRVGERLLIDDKIFHVISRREIETSVNAQVIYMLVEEQVDSEDAWSLTCTMQNESTQLNHKNESRFVCSYQIQVLATTNCRFESNSGI